MEGFSYSIKTTMVSITLFDGFILFMAWSVWFAYHESVHSCILRTASARPKFIFHPVRFCDVVATRRPKPMNDVEKLNCLQEIISYNLLSFAILLLVIGLVIFK